MLGSMSRSLNRIGEGSQTQNEWDVKNALYSQKNQSCIVKKVGGIYTPQPAIQDSRNTLTGAESTKQIPANWAFS
jgi:hypothetical protein